jgi:predicted RNA-binding protein with PUA-like domain
MSTRYWLMKSEPTSYSIDDLKRDKKTPWDGVRNYQARNFMRDDMQEGDVVFFYHSACKEPGIVGEGTVCSTPYADPTQFTKKSKYYDENSSKENPRWQLVDVCYKTTYKHLSPIALLRKDKGTRTLKTLERGSRLSITPVTPQEAKAIRNLATG